MTNKKFIFKILFLTLLSGTIGCGEERNPEPNVVEIDSLRNALAEQERLNDSLKLIIEKEDFQESSPIYFGRAFDSVENPEEFIADGLKARPELIPMDPVLGGTMEFRQIQVLSEDWVLAIYDDGHVQGKSIFSYELTPDGQLTFQHLLSASPQE